MRDEKLHEHQESIIPSGVRIVIRLRCWWFGHTYHIQDAAPIEYARCHSCDEPIPYSDMVGDTRHARFLGCLRTVRWLMFRKWWPKPCNFCGRRFKCDETADHIPF